MSRTDKLIAGWSAHTPAPVKFRELAELARAIEAQHAAMLAALKAVCACYRTFRNVPKDEQEWTATDDEALDAGFAAIAKAKGKA